VLSLVIVAALGVVANLSARSSLEASLYERLQAVIDARADGLDRWIDEQRRNVVFVGQLPGFGDDARTLLDASSSPADQTAARERLLKVLMKAAEGTGDAQEFLLLDLDGTVRLATQREYEGASQVGAEFFTVGRSHTTVQSVYPSTLTGQTGVPPYTWAVTSGTLPAGLTLSAATGDLTGTPTVSGTSTFSVGLTDTNGCGADRSYTITVLEGPPQSLVAANVQALCLSPAHPCVSVPVV